jgi:hypothetical protein
MRCRICNRPLSSGHRFDNKDASGLAPCVECWKAIRNCYTGPRHPHLWYPHKPPGAREDENITGQLVHRWHQIEAALAIAAQTDVIDEWRLSQRDAAGAMPTREMGVVFHFNTGVRALRSQAEQRALSIDLAAALRCRDNSTKRNANDLARRIESKWHSEGHLGVRAWSVRAAPSTFHVRSNLESESSRTLRSLPEVLAALRASGAEMRGDGNVRDAAE